MVTLTHLCLMDLSILINWTSPFSILGVSDVLYHFYSISSRYSSWQTVKTLIRRRVLRRLIWVCTVCLHVCSKNGTLGLYELSRTSLYFIIVSFSSQWTHQWYYFQKAGKRRLGRWELVLSTLIFSFSPKSPILGLIQFKQTYCFMSRRQLMSLVQTFQL